MAGSAGVAGAVSTVAACPQVDAIAYGTEDGGVWSMEHSAHYTNRGGRSLHVSCLQVAGTPCP